MGPHAYGLRPTRTPPHLTGSCPRTKRDAPIQSRDVLTTEPPTLRWSIRQTLQAGQAPSSSTVRVNTPCSCPNTDDVTRGLTVLAVYLKRSAIGSVALSAWPRSGPNAVHAVHADERPRRPSNALSCGPIVCRQSGGQGVAGSNPVIPTGNSRSEAVSDKIRGGLFAAV
jgi:hypothetical protein